MRFLKKLSGLDVLSILLIFALTFSNAIPNIILIFGLILFIYQIAYVKGSTVVVAPIYPYLLFVGSLSFCLAVKGYLIDDLSSIGRMLLVVLSGLVFLNSNRKYLSYAFIISINVAMFLSISKIFIHLYQFGTIELANGATVNKVLILERPYLGFVLVLSILLTIEKILDKTLHKTLGILVVVVNLIFVFYIAARLSILTVLLLMLIYFVLYYDGTWQKKSLIIFCTCSVFSIIMITNKNFVNRLKIDEGIDHFSDNEPRFVIWPCTVNLLYDQKEEIFIGPLGITKSIDSLSECYRTSIEKPSKRDWFLTNKYNPHNQFLFILLIGGVFSLVFFIYFLRALFIKSVGNYISLSLVVSLVLFFLFECILSRQFGCYIISLIICFVSVKNEED